MFKVGLLLGGLLAAYLTFSVMGKASKGYAKAKERRIERGPAVPCSTCQSTMNFVGLQDFKVAERGVAEQLGATGGNLPLELYRCPTCRKLEVFLPPAAG